MQCPYCNVNYSFGESCHCHPATPAETAPHGAAKVNGPWGEAVAAWSLSPDAGQPAHAQPSRAR